VEADLATEDGVSATPVADLTPVANVSKKAEITP
jgi:hypothetical protein